MDSLTKLVLNELAGGLWHSTRPDRFESILASGAILPEPPIDDGDRWHTAGGADYYPYVRSLGGVSLFDFADLFDPDSYRQEFPLSTWGEFIPLRTSWGSSVWIEIDRRAVASKLNYGSDFTAKGEAAKVRNVFMPQIEAAHLGPLPRAAFKRAFLARDGDSQLRPLPLLLPLPLLPAVPDTQSLLVEQALQDRARGNRAITLVVFDLFVRAAHNPAAKLTDAEERLLAAYEPEFAAMEERGAYAASSESETPSDAKLP